MQRVSLIITFLFVPICAIAMDQILEENDFSIIAIDVFDNDFKVLPSAERLSRESLLFASSQIQSNPTFINKKLFDDSLRCNDVEKTFLILKNSFRLRKDYLLARKLWDVCCNNSAGFNLIPSQDYQENIVPRECIIKVSLLLACKQKNKIFLSQYQQTHGTKSLHEMIGNNLFEEMYGATALKNIIGKTAYDEFKLGKYICEHLKKFNMLFSDEYLDKKDD